MKQDSTNGLASILRRPLLESRLDGTFGKRLTSIVAGAGFGKSTLLAEWAKDVSCAWHTAGSQDKRLPTFARGVAAAVRSCVPDLPAEITAVGGSSEHQLSAEAFAAGLCASLDELLGHDVVLVLDDVHELGRRGTAATRLVESLCRHAPPTLHLVVASRDELPFPIARLRGRGEVLELDASDLAFTQDEVAELIAITLGQGFQELARAVYAATAGWPAEVRMVVEALSSVPEGEHLSALESLRRPEGPLFSYVAEEVLEREPGDVVELLRRAAWLERVSPALCVAVGLPNAPQVVASLVSRGFLLPVESREETWFSLHALLREFLRDRRPLHIRELRTLYRRAARWFEDNGYLEDALQTAGQSGDSAELGRILRDHGARLLAGGAIEAVLEAAATLPPAARGSPLEQLIGEAHALKGDWAEALACYERAAGGPKLSPGLAWRIGRIYLDRGEPEEALEAFGRGELDGGDPADEAMLMAWIASAQLGRGELGKSRHNAARALKRATASGDPRAVAVASNVSMVLALRTDPSKAEEHFRRGLEAAESAGDVLQAIRIRSNHVAHLLQQGSFHDALAEIEPAVHGGEVAGAPSALAFALLKRGETRYYLGQLELAIADFEASRGIYERLGSSRAFGATMEIGEVYCERGDRALARAALEAAARGAAETNDAQVLIYARANLARVLAGDDDERAEELARSAVALARSSGHGIVFALLAWGWVALAHGEREKAAERARKAASAARERGDRAGLAESLELEALSDVHPARDRLEEALEIRRGLGNPLHEAATELALARVSSGPTGLPAADLAEHKLRALGMRLGPSRPAGLLRAVAPGAPVPLAIEALGGLRVRCAGNTVALGEWRSKKARDLLKILVARRGRPAPRDVLMEVLWPDEEVEALPNRLSVALTALRTGLDPERQFASGYFLVTDRHSVRLDLEHATVDVESFLAAASAGLRLLEQGSVEAATTLEAAERLYTGDFLEEDVYEDWAVSLREEARGAYVAVARGLAETSAEAGEHDAAVRYQLRILERDRYDERAHLGLVTALARGGRHGEAHRQYRRYATLMEEIEVEPAPVPG